MRIFASTPFYLQGPGALARVGEVAHRLGRRPAIAIDALVRPLVENALLAGFPAPPTIAEFTGEVTDANTAALADRLGQADLIVAVGGGKALDAGKAAALRLGVRVMTVPTIASTDGPASSGIAIYDDAHRLIRVDQMPANPAAVVVDSAVIAAAPPRFLRAGIGDAIAKAYEAAGCRAGGGKTKHGTTPTHSAIALADSAWRLLRAHAIPALAAIESGQLTEDVEATIEASVLLSAMGFENGGLSIAHGTTRGLMTLPGAAQRLHGEHVAYGTLVQIAAENRPQAELLDMAQFLHGVGLPTSLAELGATDVGPETFAAIADAILASPHAGNVAVPLTREGLITAIASLETFDRHGSLTG